MAGDSGEHQHAGADRADRPAAPARPAKRGFLRRPLVAGILIAVVAVVLVVGVLYWRHSRHYESTEDAFVDVVPQRVSPQVAGRVLRVLVGDNQNVTAGQVLLELDPATFDVKLQQAEAARAQAEAQAAQAEAQKAIRRAEVEQVRATANAADTGAANAANDLKRLQHARSQDEGVASAQQVDHAVAEQRSTEAQRQSAHKAVAAAEAQLEVVDRQIAAARAAVKTAAAQVTEAQLLRSYAQVRASVAGRIANKTVSAGDYVEPGAALMAIVPHEVYVTADFKETQLARVRPGQAVEIAIDAYPDPKLHGHVDSVQAATGAAFTPIPAQNAAGNWVKVVQRVPVKIVIDDLPNDAAHPLGPGMSAKVKVDIDAKGERRMASR